MITNVVNIVLGIALIAACSTLYRQNAVTAKLSIANAELRAASERLLAGQGELERQMVLNSVGWTECSQGKEAAAALAARYHAVLGKDYR